MGEDGVEPPEPLSNRFTAGTATPMEYSPLVAGGGLEPPFQAKEACELPILHPASTRTPRVSNDFFVLCVPLGNFS